MILHVLQRAGRLLAAVGALAVFAALPATAQTSTGSIRGVVTDSAGAPISDAQIVARNPLTGIDRNTTSRSDGFYTLSGLVPATYDITIRRIGFRPIGRQVQVQIGQVLSLNYKLASSAVEVQEVTVTAPHTTETATSEVATNITSAQIEKLPTPSRNFLDLANLAPGVTVSEDRVGANLSGGVAARTFSANGQSASGVNVFIDGASLKNDLTAGGIAGQDASRGNPFPRNAIQEYRVITQNFKAEYQKASSAIITATTKSGGNTWTGNVLFSYQNKDLVALDTFSIAAKQPKSDYSRYLTAISAGAVRSSGTSCTFSAPTRGTTRTGARSSISRRLPASHLSTR
ncbi:MAG: carboxypeptidase regulatory-like domain-containing protein [Gemmatimonadota bacterium]